MQTPIIFPPFIPGTDLLTWSNNFNALISKRVEVDDNLLHYITRKPKCVVAGKTKKGEKVSTMFMYFCILT